MTKQTVNDDLLFYGQLIKIHKRSMNNCGPGSPVGIATDYGLDSPGIEFRLGEIFHLSRPAMGPTQPPVQWVQGHSQGEEDKVWPGHAADHSPPSSAMVMEE